LQIRNLTPAVADGIEERIVVDLVSFLPVLIEQLLKIE
jgi:hypothetical protein